MFEFIWSICTPYFQKYPWLLYPLATIFFYKELEPLFRSFLSRLIKQQQETLPNKNFFESGSNARFGFSFVYPKTWDRQDPMNSDGSSYTHPKNPEIKIYFWGSYFGEEDVKKELLTHQEGKKGFKLLRITYSGKFLLQFYENEEGPTLHREPVEGWRYEYLYGKGKGKKKVMGLYIPYKRVYYNVRCEAPLKLFPIYEDIFLNTISEFVIHEKSRC